MKPIARHSPPSKFEQLRPFVEAETGMDFGGNRFDRLCEAIEDICSHENYHYDLQRLLSDASERSRFIEKLTARLTVGESFFFRNEHHFSALRETVIPEILSRNRRSQEFRIWSAGCATGEEPYSLAILVDQLLHCEPTTESNCSWQWSIQATDINHSFLQMAREAEYRPWSFRRTSIHNDPRYFQPIGNNFRLKSPHRDRVRFRYLNLVKDVYPSVLNGTTGLDLILFRNVAIYFRGEVFDEIVSRFLRCLRPGGWLLLGEAEVTQAKSDGFAIRRIGRATFFQKPAKVSATPPKVDLATFPNETPARTFSPESDSPTKDNKRSLNTTDSARDRQQRDQVNLKDVRELLERSRQEQASSLLEELLSMEPMLTEAHLLNALLAEERGELERAEAACRRALFLDRNCAMAHFQLAAILQQLGKTTDARKSFSLVQKIASEHDANALVPFADGLCYGRLAEMAASLADP